MKDQFIYCSCCLSGGSGNCYAGDGEDAAKVKEVLVVETYEDFFGRGDL